MNRSSSTADRKLSRALRPSADWRILPAAFLATLLALPVNAAVTIPNDPLASGVRVAPNILFILDDSGSMGWENINNGDISSITGSGSFSDGPRTNGIGSGESGDLTDNVGNSWTYEQNYVTNTLYYNPSVDYRPWMNADGNRLSGGTSYANAYSSANNVSYTGVESNTSGGGINLSNATRTFYVPKDAASTSNTYLSTVDNYYRFQILRSTSAEYNGKIYRAVWTNELPPIETRNATFNGTSLRAQVRAYQERYRCGWNWCYRDAYAGAWANSDGSLGTSENGTAPEGSYFTFDIPDGATNFTVTTHGADANADLYVRRGSAPTTGNSDCHQNGSTSNETCTITSPASGTWYIAVRAADDNGADFSNVIINASYQFNPDAAMGCASSTSGFDWRKCERVTPSGAVNDADAEDAEKKSFATWYSYYRTRIKAAKGGAAEAFNAPSLGQKVRVGYRSLHQNGSDNLDIPVTDGNDGRFANNDGTNGNSITSSRSIWYNRLFAASANGGTPLQSVLNAAGQYFSNTNVSGAYDLGAYGPEKGSAQLSCRQNFTILTTDGYWNGGTVSTGGFGDDNDGSVIDNGLPSTDPKYKRYQYKVQAPYKDGNTNTLADVAMRYWKTDLRTDLENNVPSDYSDVASENDQIGRDPAFWQHMVTFAISIGLKTYSGLSSVSDVTTRTTWEAPGNDDRDNIDDLLHAAVNGRGTFVSASSPQAFADGLTEALAKISERDAAFSNLGASDPTTIAAGGKLFAANYRSGRWSGLLTARDVKTNAELWKTSDSGKFAAHASRKVYTRSGTVGENGEGGGTDFPDATHQSPLLVRTGGPANYAVSASDNADYIRGDQSNEGTTPGTLRVRSTVLGDIVNSSPVYVADTGTVYVGANDGMLHAFNGSTGVEQFAYIPNILNIGKLADLSRGDYEHAWFVDGPIAVSSKAITPDKNILVGALGRGGKGVYGLNVTTPSAFSHDDVLWERASTSDTAASDNMGMVMGTPVLAKVRGTTSGAVVLGNGINSGSGKAALIVLNIETGAIIAEIATDDTDDNGLFAPTGIYAADGKTLVYAYAGDLQGNVWKFDLTSATPANWSSKKIFTAAKANADGDLVPQPITGGIATAVDPRTNKRWVFFGTGSYMTSADANDIDTGKQSMYGVMDDITGTGAAYTRSSLVSRSVTDDGTDDKDERWFGDAAVLTATQKGWYVDLPGKGERIVQNAQIDGSYLVTASMMPSGNSCADAAGSGYINALTLFPGMQASGTSYFDLDGDGNTDDTGTSGKPTGSKKTSGMPTLPLLLPGELRYQDSGNSGGTNALRKGRPQWNRVSWRELRND